MKDVQAAGFTDAQAEAVTRNTRKAQDLDLDLSSLATKSDLEKLRNELSVEIASLRTAIADSKAETIKWLFGAIGFQTLIILGGVVGLIKSLPR